MAFYRFEKAAFLRHLFFGKSKDHLLPMKTSK
jgi:hypothetical protein